MYITDLCCILTLCTLLGDNLSTAHTYSRTRNRQYEFTNPLVLFFVLICVGTCFEHLTTCYRVDQGTYIESFFGLPVRTSQIFYVANFDKSAFNLVLKQ